MAIKSNEKLWALTDRGPLQVRADRLAAGVEESPGCGAAPGMAPRGPRVYDWAAVDIRPLREPGKGHWLLARRSVAKLVSWPSTFASVRRTPLWRNW